MTFILILFIFSILGILTMLLVKIKEMNMGEPAYSSSLRSGIDTYVEDTIDKIHYTSEQLNHISLGAVVARAMRVITLSFRLMYKTAIQSENKILNFIKGRRTLQRGNHRSDFLEQIGEHKKENGGAGIEEK